MAQDRYEIVDVRCDMAEMMLGWVVGEVKLRNTRTGEVFYLFEDNVEGMVSFYRTEKSYYDEYFKAMEAGDMLPEDFLYSKEYWAESVEEFFEELPEQDEEDQLMYRYLFTIVHLGWEDMRRLIAETKGRCLDEVELPKTLAEENYEADREDEDDWDDKSDVSSDSDN